MKQVIKAGLLAVCLSLSAVSASAEEHVQILRRYLAEKVEPWVSSPVLLAAIRDQNAKHAGLSETNVLALDKQWRAETESRKRPLIDSVLSNPVSEFLKQKKQAAEGLIAEIFVMDNKGLNVAASDITSDYWQGDEAKWKKTFLAGPNAVFIDSVELDQSSQTLSSQASMAITDPETGLVIGAITVAINVEHL